MSCTSKLTALLATVAATGAATIATAPAHAGPYRPPLPPVMWASWDDIQGEIFKQWTTDLYASDLPGYYNVVDSLNSVLPFNADGYVGFTAELGLDNSTAYASAKASVGGSIDIGPIHTGMQQIAYMVQPEVHKNGDSLTAAYAIYSWNSNNEISLIDIQITSELTVDRSTYESYDLLPMQRFGYDTRVPGVGVLYAEGYASASASVRASFLTDLIDGVKAQVDARPNVYAGFSAETDQVSVGASVAPVGQYETRAEGTVRVGEIRVINSNTADVCASVHSRVNLDRAGAGGMIVLTNWTVNWPFSYEGYTWGYPVDWEQCARLNY